MTRCLMWKKEDSKLEGISGNPANSFRLRIFFFPHQTPRHRKLDFRSRLSQGWLELRLRRVNIVHDLAAVNKNGGEEKSGVSFWPIPLVCGFYFSILTTYALSYSSHSSPPTP